MRIALAQLTSSDDPSENLDTVRSLMARAKAEGADFLATPEVTNCLSASRTHQRNVLRHEADDSTLAGLREEAVRQGLWLLIGSLALKTDDPDGRFANRSFLIDPDGEIKTRYDKIHMFDVQVSETETYRESAGYRPGTEAIVAQTPWGDLGMTICYDLRFPGLFRDLAQTGAQMITVPSAFSQVTGAAHWEVLLRARAIETGAFIIAPAQTGTHPTSRGKTRKTYGHSMVVGPWGDILTQAGTESGLYLCDIDMNEVEHARARIPSITADMPYKGP